MAARQAAGVAKRGRAASAGTPEGQAAFARRRAALMRQLQHGAHGAAAVFVSGRESRRNGDVDHVFRQSSTFYYLTGFEEPDTVAVLRPGHAEPYVLFVRPHDPQMAVWVGPRAGIEGAKAEFGADLAYPIEELEERLPAVLDGVDTVYFSLGADERVERLLSRIVAMRRGAGQHGAVAIERLADPFPLVAELRLIKSREEITALQRAIDITGAGIEAAMRATRPGMHEYEVQAVLEAEYRRLGSPRDGFPSIVAAGANSCTLHYTSNRAPIRNGDLLLLDTGAEVDYYGADVSRTFPANGRFTPAQRAVYDIVWEAQRQAMSIVKPGVRFNDVHDRAVRVLVEGLRDLGVLSGRPSALVKSGAYAPYYMHATSHWLGMDVHDVGRYREGGESVALRPGMVLTVEPGLYITDAQAPRELRGIGVRIEDDVLVTRDGFENLSGAIPSKAEELEELVGRG
ncbi:MAG: aminopeptidase P N-terminal domain-containing protein [Phycisphaerales bacterium]|nr:aminopeptidase P N-terminal domain-containing protein [Phycisphaerales bacterium]